MDLQGKNLDGWFLALEATNDFSKFPHGDNYPSNYKNISSQLNKWVHPEVAVGATTTDDTFLTNHGTNHIKTLIFRVSQFLDGNRVCELTQFEVYLLLMSIHVHDVGNILGRDNHQFNAKIIIEKLKSAQIVGQDDLIWDYIYEIAKTHKGFQLETLSKEDFLHDIPFRPQLLAGILKFADELAEDFSRSSKINIDLNNIPSESNIYHVFASSVNSIIPNTTSGEIKMIFNLKEDQLYKKYDKDGKKIFLIDEIYVRTLRTYSEKVYCMKFLRPDINIDSIKVTINIRNKDGSNKQFGYELSESTVNEFSLKQAIKKCPELKDKTGKKLFDEYRKKTQQEKRQIIQAKKMKNEKATAKKSGKRS